MVKKRINTDLFIKDLIFVDKTTQEAIDLSNANNIKLSVRRQGTSEWLDQEFTQLDNKISFQWNATENTRSGTFDALLSFNKTSSLSETGKIEYKYDAISLFQIVNTSDEESGVDVIGAVQVVYYGGADGLSAYELAVKYGYTGTEEEFANIEINNVANEVIRQNNERARDLSESDRQSKEIAREQAESTRQSEFETLKQEFQDMKTDYENMKQNLVFYN